MAKKAAAKAMKTITKKGAKPVRTASRPKKAKAAKPARARATVAKAKKGKLVAAKKAAAPKKPVVAKGKKIVVKPIKAAATKAKAEPPVSKKPMAAVAAKKEAPKAATTKPASKPLAPVAKAAIKALPPPGPKPAQAPAPAPPRPVAIKKRPLKEKYQIEFQVRSTPSALYDMLLSPSGFSEWYCDDVDVRGDEYTFKWGNEEEKAMIIGQRQNEVTRFHRVDDEDEESYFEFRIKIDPITDEVALIVTDHCWPDEMENAKALWASQIAHLARVLGA